VRKIDDPQYLLSLSACLEEIVAELDALPVRSDTESMGSWLALYDASTLTMAASILGRLGLWAKHPVAESYVDRAHRITGIPLAEPRSAHDAHYSERNGRKLRKPW
jgi:hypothetical protein